VIDVKFEINDSEINKLLAIPSYVAQAVVDKAMPAMARPIIVKAKEIAPRSHIKQPGNATDGATRDKWSKSKKNGPTKNFNYATWSQDTSGDHIGYRTFKNTSAFEVAVKVGARSPRGNKQRFNQMKHTEREVYYWGKKAGKKYRPRERFMQRAYDETIPEQMSAFTEALDTEIKNLMR
jgi:hypothetical protein